MCLLDKCLKFMALDFQNPEKIFATWKLMNRILKEVTNLNELDMAACQDALTKGKAVSKKLLKNLESKLISELSEFPVLKSPFTDTEISDMPVSLIAGNDPKISALSKLFAKTPAKPQTYVPKPPAPPPREKPSKKKKKKRRLNPKPQLQKRCEKCKKHFANHLKKCDKCFPNLNS